MAKKRTTTVEEEIVDDKELNYNDIHDKSTADIVAEPAETPPAPDPEPKDDLRDEKGRFIKKDEKESSPPETKSAEQPPLDLTAMKEDLKKEISQATADKIKEALGGEGKATETQKDKYVAIAEQFQKEHGRAPLWHELVPFMVEDAKAALKAEQLKEQETQKQSADELKERQASENKRFNDHIDEQLNDLYTASKLPRIEDKNDPEDYGVKVRRALFQTMMEVNQVRVAENKPPIYSLKEIYYEHFTPPKQHTAGYDAPVSLGRGGVTPTEEPDIDYREIHGKKSILDVMMGR